MTIKKRKVLWAEGIVLPLVPIIMYGSGKLMGTQYNKFEFIWWIYIPLTLIFYFFIQFKVSSKEIVNDKRNK